MRTESCQCHLLQNRRDTSSCVVLLRIINSLWDTIVCYNINTYAVYRVYRFELRSRGIWSQLVCIARAIVWPWVVDQLRSSGWMECSMFGQSDIVCELEGTVGCLDRDRYLVAVLKKCTCCDRRLLRMELISCTECCSSVMSIALIIIITICGYRIYVHRDSDSRRRERAFNAHLMWWVCFTARLNTWHTG